MGHTRLRPAARPEGRPVVVDIRGNCVMPMDAYFIKAQTLVDRGWGLGVAPPSEESLEAVAAKTVEYMEGTGADFRLVVPRAFHLAQNARPAIVVHQWIAAYNDIVAGIVRQRPDCLGGIGALTQVAGQSPTSCFEELDRCSGDLGFVGVVLNPDPGEGDGLTPHLGDEYWYPLYERLERLDMSAIVIAGATQSTRESYFSHQVNEATIAALALIEHPEVFTAFPRLKLVISYGGGSLPYQVGRWRIRRWRQPHLEPFEESLRRLYFDTVVHTPEAMRMLFDTCGTDRCLFGTHSPGSGSGVDPATGRLGDDLRPLIDGLDSLTAEDRRLIYEDNARAVFSRLGPLLDANGAQEATA